MRERVRRFLRNIDSPFICRAGKPDPENFAKAVRMMRVGRDRAVVIGDQIFMDVFGANRCGLASILVAFIRQPGETTFGKRRAAEQVIMSFYRRNPAMRHRIGDIRKEDYDGTPPEKLRFREISPACRAVSLEAERVRKNLKNLVKKGRLCRREGRRPFRSPDKAEEEIR